MTNKVVYSAIFGDYDFIKEHSYINKDFDYKLFVDQYTYDKQRLDLINNSDWEIIIIDCDVDKEEQYLKSKDIKINPEKYLAEYDYSIYIDGSINQIGDINKVFTFEEPYKMCEHPRRICAYKEGEICLSQRKGDTDKTIKQLIKYTEDGFPENYGLFMGGVIARVHNDYSNALNKAWWNEIKNGSMRDQISLPYCSWKLKKRIETVSYDKEVSRIFKISNHN